jgi:predicted amidohydrolase
MHLLKLALIKTTPLKGDLAANHAVLMEILAEIAPHGVDVVVTPECFLDGYVVTEAEVSAAGLLDYAVDPEESAYVAAVRGYARMQRCWVINGVTRLAARGCYNSALVIDREGELRGIYDKTHIQTHDVKFLRGEALPVFDSDFGPFGVMICADRRWPETVRTLALKGARILFNPTYGMSDTRNQHMMQTRSYESEVFIAFAHPEQSLVTGPKGEVICDNRADSQRFTLCEVDLSQADAARGLPSAHLRDRRGDLYL